MSELMLLCDNCEAEWDETELVCRECGYCEMCGGLDHDHDEFCVVDD